MIGQVAIQQAMVKELGLTYRKAAEILHINHRTVWQHVAARKGAKVMAWEQRTPEQKQAAIEAARKLISK